MRVRLTVVDPAGPGAPIDVSVTAGPDTAFGALRPQLLAATGRDLAGTLAVIPLYIGDCAIPDEAVLGRAPLLEGAVLTVGSPVVATGRRGLLELHVVGGPGAGAVHRLLPGEHSLGRAAEAAVRLVDPMVSRLHAALLVSAGGVTVRDLRSTNGTAVDGRPVGAQSGALLPRQLLSMGEVTLSLALPTPAAAAVHPDGAGHVEVNRPPRLLPPTSPMEVSFPAPPKDPPHQRFPLVALLVPLALGPILFLALGNPLMLLFMLMSPLMLIGSYLSDRRQRRTTMRRDRATYDAELAAARVLLQKAVSAEQVQRRARAPDLAELLVTVTGPRSRLWERRRTDADFLELRIGTADLPAHVRVTCPAHNTDVGEPPVIDRVPVTLALGTLGVVGLAGPRAPLEALARSLVGQLAGWHSPHDLDLAVLCAEPDWDWQWASWLPHTGMDGPRGRSVPHATHPALVTADPSQVQARATQLVAMLDARAAERRGDQLRWTGRRTVIVLDGGCALRTVPGIARLLEEGPGLGIHTVCLDRDAVSLPGECGATVELSADVGGRARVTVRDAAALSSVVPDLPTTAWANRLARALAPLRDATPSAHGDGLPEHARFLDILPVDATDPATIASGWRRSPRSTRALVGVLPDGSAMAVDLARDGPHALVAGTTGAGKSELLQTLIVSLALANRPDEMAFVLVDYKGGSAFRDCARLPHTVGMVTDLDAHLTERALASLGAELRRRKTVLAAAGCKDVEDYLRQGHHDSAPLPRLVLVIDEFASLVEELPAFVGGLVSIAQLGRSLGVHLVLATQRPAGVVSADIKANTNLRIALRVTDPAESTNVIDAKDAAFIGPATPGRAVARIGSGSVTTFQSARVGGHPRAEVTDETRVHVLTGRGHWEPPAASPAWSTGPNVPTDLARIVDACIAAASIAAPHGLSVPPVPSPWLPPLGERVIVDDLPPAPVGVVPLGLCDLPAQQSRAPWGLDLERGGHLLVVGGPRSGRTTLLRTLAGSVAIRFGVGDVHLFGIDGASGGLLTLAGLPQVGAVIAREDLTRADRLLGRLLGEVTHRQDLFRRWGVASIAEQHALAGSGSGPPLPYLVLLLDSWEGLVQAFEAIDHGRPLETILRLVREGSSVGLRVVITGDRAVLGARVGSLIADRLLLRFPDRGDYALAGIPARLVPKDLPPGRGLLAESIVETQVALLSRDPAGQAQVTALGAIAERVRLATSNRPPEPPDRRPMRVAALPSTVQSSALAAAAEQAATGPLWTLIGVGGDEGDCLGVDLAADGPGFVVAGPAGSGRSTTLLTMGWSLLTGGASALVVAPPRSPVRELVGHPGVLGAFGAGEGPALSGALSAGTHPLVVLVDDVEFLQGDSGIEDELMALLRAGGDPTRALVVAGSAAELAQQFRGLGAQARKNRLGLILAPSGGLDGGLLGLRVPRGDERTPGRGVLVRRGTLTNVQVAVPG